MQANQALVLNADFRPLSYFPLSLISWRDAVQALFAEKVSAVAEYDAWARSPSREIRLPSVVALREYQPLPKRVAFTRFNVFLRDRFRCQYCDELSLRMKPLRPPVMPSPQDLLAAKRAFPPNYLHESWRDFLYWDVELEA